MSFIKSITQLVTFDKTISLQEKHLKDDFNIILKDIKKSFSELTTDKKSFNEFNTISDELTQKINTFKEKVDQEQAKSPNIKFSQDFITPLKNQLASSQNTYLEHAIKNLIEASSKDHKQFKKELEVGKKFLETVELQKKELNQDQTRSRSPVIQFYQNLNLPLVALRLIGDNHSIQLNHFIEESLKIDTILKKLLAQQTPESQAAANKTIYATLGLPSTSEKIQKYFAKFSEEINNLKRLQDDTISVVQNLKKTKELSENMSDFVTNLSTFENNLKSAQEAASDVLNTKRHTESLSDKCTNAIKAFDILENLAKRTILPTVEKLQQAHPEIELIKEIQALQSLIFTKKLALLNFNEMLVSYSSLYCAFRDQSLGKVTDKELEQIKNNPFGFDSLKSCINLNLIFIDKKDFAKHLESPKTIEYLTQLKRCTDYIPKLKSPLMEKAFALLAALKTFKEIQQNLDQKELKKITADKLKKIQSSEIDLSPLSKKIEKNLEELITIHLANKTEKQLNEYLMFLGTVLANCSRLKTPSLETKLNAAMDVLMNKPRTEKPASQIASGPALGQMIIFPEIKAPANEVKPAVVVNEAKPVVSEKKEPIHVAPRVPLDDGVYSLETSFPEFYLNHYESQASQKKTTPWWDIFLKFPPFEWVYNKFLIS